MRNYNKFFIKILENISLKYINNTIILFFFITELIDFYLFILSFIC